MAEPSGQKIGEKLGRAFYQALAGEDRTPERVSIEHATDVHYQCRVWFIGEDDFDAYQLTYPADE